MAAREDKNVSFRYLDTMELGLLNGAEINLGLDATDFHLLQTYDLNSYSFSREGAEIVIDYLADRTKEYFWYAQREIEAQKLKKRSRRPLKAF